MVEQGLLDAPMFALWLSPDPFAEPAGAVHFGGHDRARYTGVMHELPVISTKYWTVGLTGVRVGGYAVRGVAAEGAIMDSGTSMLTASDADAAAINQARRAVQGRAGQGYSRATHQCMRALQGFCMAVTHAGVRQLATHEPWSAAEVAHAPCQLSMLHRRETLLAGPPSTITL